MKISQFTKKAGLSNLVSLVMLIVFMILLYYLMLNKFDFQATVTDILGMFSKG